MFIFISVFYILGHFLITHLSYIHRYILYLIKQVEKMAANAA